MNRPFSDNRPVEPFFQDGGMFGSGGQCKIRAKFSYTSREGSVEVRQSLERRIQNEIEDILPIDNLRTMEGEFGAIDVAFDVEKSVFTDQDEEDVERAIKRSLMDAGVERPTLDQYTYRAVSR